MSDNFPRKYLSLQSQQQENQENVRNSSKLILKTPALKIMARQRSLTVAIVFVTAERLCRMFTMTSNTHTRQQLLTTIITIFATSFKMIFAIRCHREVNQTKLLYKPNQIVVRCTSDQVYRGGNRNHCLKLYISRR